MIVVKKLTAQEISESLPPYMTMDESTYVRTGVKARFVDAEYGEWWTTPNKVRSGRVHPSRSMALKSAKVRTSSVDIVSSLPEYVMLDESTYIKASAKARFIDSEHGEFWGMPYKVIRGTSSHPKRAILKSAKSRTYSVKEIEDRLPSFVKLVGDTYVNVMTKCKFIDSEYGEWTTSPNAIFSGHLHPSRSEKVRITKFVESQRKAGNGT